MPPVWIPSFERTIDFLSSERKWRAEKLVAQALNRITSSDVKILHSLGYSKSRSSAARVNLEFDFLLIWKHRGILILEVKGGNIYFDANEKKWWRIPKGHPKEIVDRNPVEQVEGQKNDLCKYILPNFLPKRINSRNLVERVLVFPDVSSEDFRDQRGLRPHRIDDFEIESIVTKELMQSLPDYVDCKLKPCEVYVTRMELPGLVFENIVNGLRPSVTAEIHPQHILEDAEIKIESATNEQIEHLNHVIQARWLLIDGPAGSAKTVLGLSAILTWLADGESAYYVTASKYLAEGLRKDQRYMKVKDRIFSLLDFFEIVLNTKVSDDDAMIKALAECDLSCEGISLIIDEAQDLNKDLYESIVSLLPCKKMWVMYDNFQALTKANDSHKYFLGQMSFAMPYTLTKNCRNAKPIAEYIKRYVELPSDYINDLLPEGDIEPEVVMTTSMVEQDSMLLQILSKIEKKGYPKKDIVVISCHVKGNGAVHQKYCSPTGESDFGSFFSYGGNDSSRISIYHCLDFRGLESPCVIVTDIQDQEATFRASYLAGSRAKCLLYMIRVEDINTAKAKESKIPKGKSFE